VRIFAYLTRADWLSAKLDLMKAHNLLKAPFYAQLIYVIESCICKADRSAEKMGLRLTDSNIMRAAVRMADDLDGLKSGWGK